MKTKTLTCYTISELKTNFPEAYAEVLKRWQDTCLNSGDTPWLSEIADSLKAVFKASGVELKNWSIGSDRQCSFLCFDMGDVGELTGARAMSWLENNLFYKIRKPFSKPAERYKTEKHHNQKKPYYLSGWNRSCPFTGVCFDEDFLMALRENCMKHTLKDCFAWLGDTASELCEQAEEDELSTDSMEANWGELDFDSEGNEI